MFDISEKLIVAQSDEICLKSTGKFLHGDNYLWSMLKKSSVSRMQRFMYFSDSVFCLGKVNQNQASNTVWEDKLTWFKDSPQYRSLDTINGEPMEFEWNIFPGFTTLQLVDKVQEFTNKMGDPAQFQGRIIFMLMFNDIMWGSKDNETECTANSTIVSLFTKRFPAGHWSFLGPGSEKKWYSTHDSKPQPEWDRVAELMMIKLVKADTQSSDPRVQSQIYVKNRKPAMLEQGDLFGQNNLTHCLCRQVL